MALVVVLFGLCVRFLTPRGGEGQDSPCVRYKALTHGGGGGLADICVSARSHPHLGVIVSY